MEDTEVGAVTKQITVEQVLAQVGLGDMIAIDGLVAVAVANRCGFTAREVKVHMRDMSLESLVHAAAYGADVLRQRCIAVGKDDTIKVSEYDEAISRMLARLRGLEPWETRKVSQSLKGSGKVGSATFNAAQAGLTDLVNAMLVKAGKKPQQVDLAAYVEKAKVHPQLPDYVAKAQRNHDETLALAADLDFDIEEPSF
jgi:hypothetical protein